MDNLKCLHCGSKLILGASDSIPSRIVCSICKIDVEISPIKQAQLEMSQQTFIALLNNQSIQKRSDITGIFAKNYGIAIIENNDIPFGKIKIT